MGIKKIKMEEFFETTFSEEFLQEADAEYVTAQIAGSVSDAEITDNRVEGYDSMLKLNGVEEFIDAYNELQANNATEDWRDKV